uniref:Uncharacterized protein n=1 Tax=Parascaris univalens TaxID=6257 RepID=A0A915AQA7_PARUN
MEYIGLWEFFFILLPFLAFTYGRMVIVLKQFDGIMRQQCAYLFILIGGNGDEFGFLEDKCSKCRIW